MPDFRGFTTVLKVTDMEQSLDFYCKLLGFEIAWKGSNDGGGENTMVESGPIRFLLTTGNHLGDKPVFTGTFYLEMTGLEAFYTRIRDHVKIQWPLERMEYGQMEFGISDPDGYTLAFAEPITQN